ncbi:MAG TPA: Ig-like domain-containing protein, partial [Longimicrobiaceae bacterium]|nr:Ig-like domain-containing protein [Longimicrobiaceae bacterium]
AGVGSLAPATFNATAVRVASVAVSQASGTVGRGESLRLTATPRDAAGNPLAGRSVQWSSSSPATAAVSDAGVVTGLAYGTATITAASEGRTATTALRVTSEDRTPPRLKALSISAATVDVTSGPAHVNVILSATDAGAGVGAFSVRFTNPSPSASASCGNQTSAGGVLASGSPADGVWQCTVTIPKGAPAGTWQLQVSLRDTAGNSGDSSGQALRAAGFPDSLVVVNSGPSNIPRITAVSLAPVAVDVSDAAATVDVSISAAASAGVRYLYAYAKPGRGADPADYARECQVWVPTGQIVTSGTWMCRLTIPRSAPAGTWNVSTLVIQDQAGTVRFYGGEKPETMEFSAQIQVTSRTEDLVPPVLTGLSLSTSSLDLSTGAKSVDVTLTATDAETGPRRAYIMLGMPNQYANGCETAPLGGTAKTATLKCTHTFGPSTVSGTWKVVMVSLYDAVGNRGLYETAQLKAAGFPTEITVTR